MNASTAPPQKSAAALQGGNAESMRHRTYNVRPMSASEIPPWWEIEGRRLLAEAERSGLVRDWKATALHLAGMLKRTTESEGRP